MEKEKLVQEMKKLANSVLENPKYKDEFEYLLKKTNKTKEDLIASVVNYTVVAEEFENHQYSEDTMRLTLHLTNLLEGTYHQDKERVIFEYIKKNKPKTITDIGYGVVSDYVFKALKEGIKVNLVDMDENSEKVSRLILKYRGFDENLVSYTTHNMDTNEYIGDYDCYVMIDSIEHTKDPTKYLHQLVKNSPKNARFIFSIPLMKNFTPKGEEITHYHFYEWLTYKDADKWLNEAGLEVLDSRLLVPNPRVDHFAYLQNEEVTHYYPYLVNCRKK